MNLSEFCIKRPVFGCVLSLILIVIGIVSYRNISTAFFPKMVQSSIIVTTYYPGASAELVESSVTTPLEKNLNSIEGIKSIESTSSQGASNIDLRLNDGMDVYQIANFVRDHVTQAMNELPSNIKPPQVLTGQEASELMDLGFTSSTMDLNALRDYLDRFISPQLNQVNGVSSTMTLGANPYAMRIELDPQKMAALQVDIRDIQTAIANSNIELPAGSIKDKSIELPITAQTKLYTAADFANIVIKKNNGQLIRLSEVARVELGTDNNKKVIVRINGEPGLMLQIFTDSTANPIATAARINRLLESVSAQLPPGVNLVRSWDESLYMKSSVHEVYSAIGIAITCVTLIILLFLGRIKSALIPVITIPICLISTFSIMFFFNFTVNVITLLALVLSIGLVVDDAIVMLENIHRHVEQGQTPLQAAILGSKEITFSIIAMTITLAAVYAPIALIKSHAAIMFQSFALTLAGSVLISGFVALTLSPMMCSLLLSSHTTAHSPYQEKLNQFFHRLTLRYQQLLLWILRFRGWTVAVAALITFTGFFIFKSIPHAFVPAEDMGVIVTTINTPAGSPPELIDQQLKQITAMLKSFPEITSTLSFASTMDQSFSGVFIMLKPYNQRHRSAETLAGLINQQINAVPTLNATAFPPQFGSGMQSQLQLYLMGSNTYNDLYRITQNTITALKSWPGLSSIVSNMNFDSQQYVLTVNRPLANDLGINVRDIDSTLQAFLGGMAVSTFDMAGQSYNVYMEAADNYAQNINALSQFNVRNNDGKLVPLGTLVNIQATLKQSSLQHFNRLRATALNATLAPGYTLGDAVQRLQMQLPTLLPTNTKFAFTGKAQKILDSAGDMSFIFILAIIFIFLVLSAQFESFLDPLIILLAVPLSLVSALISLKLAGGSLNIYTIIGLVTLIGLISKHGILITQFANQLQQQGLSAQAALLEAANIRLRPILMTTAAMAFGALPLVLASGAGAESRQQIGIITVSGLVFGTLFSLVLVPVTYSYVSQLKMKIRIRR